MNIFYKIWLTWLVLAIPIFMSGWMFFDEDELKHSTVFFNLMLIFAWLPVCLSVIGMFIYAIMVIWGKM